MSYETKVFCTNANVGTFNHECGKPAEWLGDKPNGWRQAFCDRCKNEGDEARNIIAFHRLAKKGVL